MNASASNWPLKVFKIVYLVLLLLSLNELGWSLGKLEPGFITGLAGKTNAAVGLGVYIFMLLAAGVFIFAAYIGFEAFEDRRGPFKAMQAPSSQIVEYIEVVLRLGLVSLLTVKLWRPSTDGEAALYVCALSVFLLTWFLLVRTSLKADFVRSEMQGTILLPLFAIAIWWFSSDKSRAAEFSLPVALVLFCMGWVLLSSGVKLLKRLRPSSLAEFVR
jgi:hypothetical protein